MARDQARMWIKDMPMKHYARARSGIGPYASLVASHLPGAGQLSPARLRAELGAKRRNCQGQTQPVHRRRRPPPGPK